MPSNKEQHSGLISSTLSFLSAPVRSIITIRSKMLTIRSKMQFASCCIGITTLVCIMVGLLTLVCIVVALLHYFLVYTVLHCGLQPLTLSFSTHSFSCMRCYTAGCNLFLSALTLSFSTYVVLPPLVL